MLHKKQLQVLLYKFSQYGFWIFSGLLAFIGLLQKLDRTNWGDWYISFRGFVLDRSWWLILGSSLALFVCKHLPRIAGSPQTWDLMHDFLDGLRDYFFREDGYDVPDFHRATLFRCQRNRRKRNLIARFLGLCGAKPKWLVPVVRSNHISQETEVAFRIDDSIEKCEGVAGRAWHMNNVVSVYDLPEISLGSAAKEVKDYAKKSFVSPDWVRNKCPKSRSILAIPVRVKGEMWGVLVFDSRHPQKIGYKETEDLYLVLSKHLSNLVEKAL